MTPIDAAVRQAILQSQYNAMIIQAKARYAMALHAQLEADRLKQAEKGQDHDAETAASG